MPARERVDVENCLEGIFRTRRRKAGFAAIGRGEHAHRSPSLRLTGSHAIFMLKTWPGQW